MPIGSRYHTGQTNPETGTYSFDGYLDGTSTPAPTTNEKEINLSRGETFPPVRSSNKSAYWKRSA